MGFERHNYRILWTIPLKLPQHEHAHINSTGIYNSQRRPFFCSVCPILGHFLWFYWHFRDEEWVEDSERENESSQQHLSLLCPSHHKHIVHDGNYGNGTRYCNTGWRGDSTHICCLQLIHAHHWVPTKCISETDKM